MLKNLRLLQWLPLEGTLKSDSVWVKKKKSELKFFGRTYYGIRKKNYIEIYGALVDRKSEICLQDNAAPLKSVQSGKLRS